MRTSQDLPDRNVVACSLGAGQGERIAQWHEALSAAPQHSVAGGVRIELPIDALGTIAGLAVAEQECCPFFGFDIALQGAQFTLTITTPPAGRSMLDELLPGVVGGESGAR